MGNRTVFYYSEHRTVDSKRNVIVNVHVEAANINDVTPMPEILDEIEARLGTLPKYMGLDAGYPQRMDSASAGDEGDTRGNWLPTAHTQRSALREVPFSL